MNLRKKILRRLELFIRSIPAITRALFIEPRKHPWRLILDILVLPSDKRYQRTLKYIGRYYKIKKLLDSKNQFVINFREMNIIVNSSLINNKRKEKLKDKLNQKNCKKEYQATKRCLQR